MSIDTFKWKNRLLIIHQKDADHLKELKANEKGIRDRHLIWMIIKDGKITSNYPEDLPDQLASTLQKQYFKGDTTAVIIGKDGGVKAKYQKYTLKEIFTLIDTMPMRQREMRQ